MSKAVVGLLAGGAATVVVGAGGFLAYNQLSQPNTSNVSVQQANTNTKPTRSIKSELLGTWVQTFKTDDPDNPKNKIEFTADEVITYTEVVTYTDEEVPQKKKNTETDKGKYKIFCGQFLELKDGKSEAVTIGKFTIDGDELTIAGKTKDLDKKYKRESRNTAANTSTDTADSTAEEVTLNPKDLVGTWIDTEKPEFKYVFTEDKMTASRNDEQMDEGIYKLPCGQVLESTDERGINLFFKVTIEGSEMTIYRNGEKYKLRRESAGDNLKTDNVENTSSPSPQSENGGTESNGLPTPEMEFLETQFDFATVNEGEKVSYTYEFKNTGKSPLMISNVKPSCVCTTVNFPKEPIQPGQWGQLTVTFDSKNKAGKRYQKVTITANTDPPQSYLYLTGEVR